MQQTKMQQELESKRGRLYSSWSQVEQEPNKLTKILIILLPPFATSSFGGSQEKQNTGEADIL